MLVMMVAAYQLAQKRYVPFLSWAQLLLHRPAAPVMTPVLVLIYL
jgi:uncharacterized membrane-anchored protein